MAIAGKATGGFTVTLADNGYTLYLVRCTTHTDRCDDVEAALDKLARREPVTIKASDSDALRRAWKHYCGME